MHRERIFVQKLVSGAALVRSRTQGADEVQVQLEAAANFALQVAMMEQGCASVYALLARHRQVESFLP